MLNLLKKMEILEILKLPLFKYFRFLLNFFLNKFKYGQKKMYQSYMSILNKTKVGDYVKLYPYAKLNHSEVGSYTYIGANTVVSRTKIGKFCSIGPNCLIGPGKHPTHYVATSPAFYSRKARLCVTFSNSEYFEEFSQINIGNDVWIGEGVLIMGGVEIGDGAIIAAKSVVTKDVPSYAICGGIPAKLIRYRFSQEIIQILLSVKWWNKDESWLRHNFKSFHDIKLFLSLFGY